MKVSWNINPQLLVDSIKKNMQATAPKIVEAVSKEIEINAQKNFNKAINDISGDNPYIVVSRVVNGNSATITCKGEQVLYAEFGAGQNNAYYEMTLAVGDYSRVSSKGTTFAVKGYDRTITFSAKGFKGGGMNEYMPRPPQIGELGANPMAWHVPSWGMRDFWFRKTTNGRVGSMETIKKTKSGEQDPRYVWTLGTRPVRGLYRARNTARNKLLNGRLNIK